MNLANDVLWRRLIYMLSPQLDIYRYLANYLENKRVLEVGFGTGIGVLQYAPKAISVDAVEIDERAVEFARKCFPTDRINWRRADILSMNTYLSRYDAIVMIEVLEHIEDWKKALSIIHGLLEDDGKLYLSSRNANADLRKNDLHEREWTAKELRDNLLGYFGSVELFDYKFQIKLEDDSRHTPIMAIARKRCESLELPLQEAGARVSQERTYG